MTTLAQEHDCLLLDLDGTVFRGHEPTPGAVDTLAAVTARTLYVTNNASRGPSEVAQHLRAMGFAADARRRRHQCAKRRAACWRSGCRPGRRCSSSAPNRWPPRSETSASSPVRLWSDDPVAVVQGHSPETAWPDLAEAALAIRGGALWVAANVDRTLPSERGLLPGNGSMVAALAGGDRP